VDKFSQSAEASVHVRGKDIFVETEDQDLYAAIDLLIDKLDRQILKYKDRLRAHPHESVKRNSVG
jgi:putative sigma-54 modulation protein